MSLNFGQTLFPPRGEQLVNYSFIDIADGTGVVVFYGGTTESSLVSGARLATNKFYSQNVATTSNKVGQQLAFGKYHDIDFDVDFLMPQNIKGNVVINVPSGIQINADPGLGSSFINARVRKYNSSGETELTGSTGVSGAIIANDGAINTYVYNMDCIEATIPLTHFKAGETLRLTIEMWIRTTDASTDCDFFFGHDPQGRATSDGEVNTFGTEPSTLTFQVPFKLNI